jgi:hypothetical protein
MQQRPAQPSDPAKTAAIMVLVAGVLIVAATISKSWFGATERGAGIHLGPLGAEVCVVGGVCADTSIPAGKLGGDIEVMMMLAALAGFVSAAGCAWFGFAALTGKKDKLPPVKLLQIVLGIASFSFMYFAIRVLTKGELKELSPSWAMFVGIGGVILGSVGVLRLKPHLPTAGASAFAPLPWQQQQQPYGQPPVQGQPPMQGQPQPGYGQQPPMQQPQQSATHACPRCGQPLVFVQQYQRWFCQREQQYV